MENIPDDVLKNCDDMWKAYSLSNFQCKSRKWLIKYLSTLPTVRFDSKINKILKLPPTKIENLFRQKEFKKICPLM